MPGADMDANDVNLMNRQLVGSNGDTISVMTPAAVMSKDDALVHAAWLVALADPLGERFTVILDRVLNT